MSAPRTFDDETQARAVRLYQDRLLDHGVSKLAARKHVGQLLDVNPGERRVVGSIPTRRTVSAGHIHMTGGGTLSRDRTAGLVSGNLERAAAA